MTAAKGSERWKAAPGYPDYEVSSTGRVRRLSTGRELEPTKGPDGYRLVSLVTDMGDRPAVRVHTLVLTAFVGPRPDGKVASHVDGDPSNDALSNLTWAPRPARPVTSAENVGRSTVQILLRLDPVVAGQLRALAKHWGVSISDAATQLIQAAAPEQEDE